MKRSLLLILAAWLLLPQCSHVQQTDGSSTSARNAEPLSIAFSANRQLELETCDCQLRQVGGVDREWNLVQKWKNASIGGFLYLSGGTHFVPIPDRFETRNRDHYINKANYLIQALNQLDISAAIPTAEDFSLGTEAMRRLKEQAKFPFVSANLIDRETAQPFFDRYLELKHGNLKILLIGLSTAPHPAYPPNADVHIQDPFEALKDVFSQTEVSGRLIVLVSSLPEDVQESIRLVFPQIHIYLGADPSATPTFNVRQWRGRSLYLNPTGRGRSLALLEFELNKPMGAFYNPQVASNTTDLRDVWKTRLRTLQAQMVDARTENERTSLENEIEELTRELDRTATIPLQPNATHAPYQYSVVELDDSFALPQNPLNLLLEAYVRSLKNEALKEDEGISRRNPQSEIIQEEEYRRSAPFPRVKSQKRALSGIEQELPKGRTPEIYPIFDEEGAENKAIKKRMDKIEQEEAEERRAKEQAAKKPRTPSSTPRAERPREKMPANPRAPVATPPRDPTNGRWQPIPKEFRDR